MQTEKLVLLAGEGFSTRVVYNALSREFSVDKVIIENPVPRQEFLQRRAKKLGLVKVIGQVFFQAGIIPFLKKGSQNRIAEIKSQFDLDDSKIDSSKIINVESVNDEQTGGILKDLNVSANSK